MIQIKLDLEKIYLVVFFAIFLGLGTGTLFDYKIKHDFPYAYLASDAFQHQTRAESIKDADNYKNEASYIVLGVEGVTGYYPPGLYDLSVVLSHLSGLEVYDTIYFLIFFFAAFAVLVMYLIIRQFNKNVAIIAMPISLLIFSNGLYTGFTWGHWPALLSQFFLICIFWYTSRIDLEKSYIFLGTFLAASFMTHTSEALFAGIYLFLFFALMLLAKKLNFATIRNIIYGFIIFAVFASYYFLIFRYVWVPRQPFEFGITSNWDNPTMYISDFKILTLFMLAGFIFSFFYIKKYFVPALISLSMLLIGLGNYFGFREKAFQLRFFWPIFLSFFIGAGIYYLFKLIIKEYRFIYSIAMSALIIVVIVFNSIPYAPHYNKLQTNGLMDPFHWEAFNWIAKNADQKSKIYFFYGDIYNQDALLRNSKRTHFQVVPEDFINAIQEKEIRRLYQTDLPGDSGGGAPIRKSLFSYEFELDKKPADYFSGKKDICSFDYLVFDKVSRQGVLGQYNILIATELVKKDYISKVFENQVVLILKNNKVGEDCIEQRTF